ncbi:MAG TPA: TonB-dependent receptor [Candidatus Angelobacter sp.]|nr:TonB-dependent receptor [Candidatus Angelobacter sp.]
MAQTASPAQEQPAPAQATQTAPPQPASPQPSPVTAPAPPSPFGEITGIVKSGNIPLPGVTVSAANSLTGKKYVTSTDVDGSFKIAVGGKGRYVVRAEFSAFAPVTQEIVINEQNRAGKADLSMMLLSRAQKPDDEDQGLQTARTMAAAGARQGMQQLALSGGGADISGGGLSSLNDPSSLAGAGLPNAGLAADGGAESVAVSGAMGRAEQNPFDPGEMQDRIADMREQLQFQGGTGTINLTEATGNIQILGGGMGGGFGGGGGGPMIFMIGGPGGPGGGGRGGRGMRGFDVNKPHGSLFYTYDGSLLDAKPYSLNGQPETKADYNQNRYGATVGGPLNIPHIYHGGNKTFLFANYTGSRSSNPYDVFSTVPTLAERGGNFSGQQVAISPVAAQLLPFIPQPNLPGDARNFHFVSAAPSHTDTMFVRFNHNFGADQGMFGPLGGARRQIRQQQGQGQKKPIAHWAQSINGGFVFNDLRNTLLNPFPTLGGRQTVHSYNANFGYLAVKGLFLNSLRFNYNRSNSNTVNNFTNVNNIESQLGISGVSPLPGDFGLPVLNFAPEFSSLQDLTPAFRNNQTFTISDSMTLSHRKHSWTWGGDFRRLLYDVTNAANARGAFVFTGAASGISPFADFLEGFAAQTSIQFGSENYQFRANSWDVFLQDNWRMGKKLSLNLGLRYERVTPYTETDGQLVNLDLAPNFSAVAPVLPGQVGPITGRTFPSGLINSSHYDFAPRAGIAWKPFSKTVVRAGYSINYNLAQYGAMATQLGFQPPFAVAQINPAPTPTSLTLQNGFPASPPSPNHITNTYAVDPNFQLPYVQTWNLNIQQEISSSLLLNIGYTGAKGTHLDIVDAPDQTLTGAPIFAPCTPATPAAASCVSPFLYEFSEGTSIMHAATVRLRKRLRHGLSVGGAYTFSKSIDDASSIGGGSSVVAQNAFDVAAERGLSSFNQTHRFTADYYYELPMGTGKKWFNKDGWEQRVLGGFSWSGNIVMASGFPFSPRIFGSAADINRGVSGSARPNLAPGQSIQVRNPGIGEWFNTAAFVAPFGPFGDAGRNIITGPGTVSVNMAFSKTVQIKEMQSFELRLSANNVFNHANFSSVDTTLGSPTFGQVTAVGAMRTAQITARYRF